MNSSSYLGFEDPWISFCPYFLQQYPSSISCPFPTKTLTSSVFLSDSFLQTRRFRHMSSLLKLMKHRQRISLLSSNLPLFRHVFRTLVFDLSASLQDVLVVLLEAQHENGILVDAEDLRDHDLAGFSWRSVFEIVNQPFGKLSPLFQFVDHNFLFHRHYIEDPFFRILCLFFLREFDEIWVSCVCVYVCFGIYNDEKNLIYGGYMSFLVLRP